MPKGLKTSATLHLRPLVLALATLGSTPLATASPQQTPGEEYVNRNEGFRLLLPPGWRKVEETTKRTEGSLRTGWSAPRELESFRHKLSTGRSAGFMFETAASNSVGGR